VGGAEVGGSGASCGVVVVWCSFDQ